MGPAFGDPVGHGYCSHPPVPCTSHPGWVLKRRAEVHPKTQTGQLTATPLLSELGTAPVPVMA